MPNYSAPIQLNVLEKIMLTLITIDNLETQLLASRTYCSIKTSGKQEHEHFEMHHHWLLFSSDCCCRCWCSAVYLQSTRGAPHCPTAVPLCLQVAADICSCALALTLGLRSISGQRIGAAGLSLPRYFAAETAQYLDINRLVRHLRPFGLRSTAVHPCECWH